MSDTTQDLQGTAEHPSGAPEHPAPDAEASYGMELALGATRDALRAASPIVAEIRKIIEFHDSGTVAQAIRDVMGTIARAADEASRHRPRKRAEPEFAEMTGPVLRQVAALARVWQMIETVDLAPLAATVPEGTPSEQFEALTADLPEGTLTVEVSPAPPVPEQAEQVAAIEERVRAEREREGGTVETVDPPDPFDAPAALDPDAWLAEVPAQPAVPDPFDVPFPLTQAEWDRARGFDDIPF